MKQIKVTQFSEIESEFLQRVHTAVWCSVATIDRKERPRSRILHPIWKGKSGYILTWQNSLKAKHIAHNPHLSLAYIADILKPTYVDCKAEWIDDTSSKQHIWDAFLNEPEPLGYDPAQIFERVDHPNLGLLKLSPWRIELYHVPVETKIWHLAN